MRRTGMIYAFSVWTAAALVFLIVAALRMAGVI